MFAVPAARFEADGLGEQEVPDEPGGVTSRSAGLLAAVGEPRSGADEDDGEAEGEDSSASEAAAAAGNGTRAKNSFSAAATRRPTLASV